MERGVTFPAHACGNHNALGQSEQTVLVGRRGFVENDVFERGGA